MKSQTVKVNNVFIDSIGIIVGKKEKEGPLGKYFKNHIKDSYFNQSSFELAQKELSNQAIKLAISKSRYESKDIEIAFGGDLSNQIFVSTSSINDYYFPYIGVYAACASFNLSLILGCIYIDNQLTNNALCFTSSHLGVSEKQFRYPNEYGIQKSSTNTTTTTGGVAVILKNKKDKVKISAFSLGRIVDVQSKNVNDMGTCMAYAAIDTFKVHLKNMNRKIADYDKIVTGDLSLYGSKVFHDELLSENYDLTGKYDDCGLMIYDLKKQDVNAGGSGPSCVGLVTFSYFINKLIKREYKRILIIATGALHSQISSQQKQSIPCIAHAIEMEVNYDY